MLNTLDTLLSPTTLGSIAIKNRVIMAPLTRVRTVNRHTPSDLMVEHYTQRASSGLIIAEATMIMEGYSAFQEEPGIYSDEQITAWKKVCDSVHNEGGKIVLQLWHGGRACHPDLNDGREAVAPSAIAITNNQSHTFDGKKDYTVPCELTIAEIHTIIAGFKQAAINAKLAGFDGIELHGANGYLLDNFLRDGSNKRNDEYGGSLENRARFLFETLKAVSEVWGSDKVGLRISPINQFNSMSDSNPAQLTRWLCEQLNDFNLAYLHIMRGDVFGVNDIDIMSPAISTYIGNIIANMGYSAEEAEQETANGNLAAVAFGTPFIANPDLVERFQQGAQLNTADPRTFYGKGEKGYTDYPTL
ncbi:MAG: alkene reductase [Sinobacterium sp.]|nr:alkene reductase [Sinobacterium sp.]